MTTLSLEPFKSAKQPFSTSEEVEMIKRYDKHLTLIKIFFNPDNAVFKRLEETATFTKKTNVRFITLKDKNNHVQATAIFINNLLLNLRKLPQKGPLVFDDDLVNDLPLNIFLIHHSCTLLEWFPFQSKLSIHSSQTHYPNTTLNIGPWILLNGTKLKQMDSDTSEGQALVKKYKDQLDNYSTQDEMHIKLKPLFGATFINAVPLLFYHKNRGKLMDVAFFVNELLLDLNILPAPLLVFENDRVNNLPLKDFAIMPSL